MGAVGWRPFHAHNSFIQMATSLGFVGLTLFVAIVIVGLWRSIAFAARGELVQAWPFAIIGYLTAVSASETYLGTQNAIEMIFFTAALVYASPYRARERVR